MADTTALGAAKIDELIVRSGRLLGLARARVWDAIKLRRRLAHINVLGGCCGTDHRHVEEIALACKEAA